MRQFVSLLVFLVFVGNVTAQEVHEPFNTDCWFTVTESTQSYVESNLINPKISVGTVETGETFPVLEVNSEVILLAIRDITNFWLPIENGIVSGDCEAVTGYDNVVSVLDNTRLWSEPNVISGSIIISIPGDATVTILGGTAIGRIRYGDFTLGSWYPVQYGTQRGWVWSERLDFEELHIPIETAYTLENARLWSQPNVNDGYILLQPLPNRQVEVIGGPVSGYIRYDNFETGVWYQVQIDNTIGWIWENRLSFQ